VKRAVEIWAYCITPCRVHLIAVPQTPEGLSRAILGKRIDDTPAMSISGKGGEVTCGRGVSRPSSWTSAIACAPPYENNPVKAKPEAYAYSSARATCQETPTFWSTPCRCLIWSGIGKYLPGVPHNWRNQPDGVKQKRIQAIA
jgi:hypothetical protein